MTRFIAARALLALLVVPAFAVVNDVVYDHVRGHRYCLSQDVAARSPELTDLLCVSPGIQGRPLPRDLDDALGEAAGATQRALRRASAVLLG